MTLSAACTESKSAIALAPQVLSPDFIRADMASSSAWPAGLSAPRAKSTAAVGWCAAQAVAVLPFDLARAQHAHAVRSGLVPRSLLASAALERSLGAMERFTLGPLARWV